MNDFVIRNWNIDEGVLSFKYMNGNYIPTANEIYAAIFEDSFSLVVTSEESEYLKSTFAFSRYPIDLRIVLESGVDGASGITLSIQAILDGSCIPLAWHRRADHVIIDKTWHPFVPGLREEIDILLNSAGISGDGKIKLGHYLFLLKNQSELVENRVEEMANNFPADTVKQKPASLKAALYPYQEKGWQWLDFMRGENVGGILADEMGLGKTLQIIALLVSKQKDEIFPSLIICPTTLLENWRREFEKFAPHVSTHIHQGPQRTGFPTDLKQYDVIISAYDTIVRDSSLFDQIQWKIVICDEAQAIKNPDTRRAKAVKRVPRQLGFAVTGTPIENRLMDLWSIMDFAVPDFLGDKAEFENIFENIADGAARLERLVTPLILRRRVAEVARDLPAKLIIPQIIPLSPDEMLKYEQIRLETEKEFQSNASLVVLIRLRMFCTHPFLLEESNTNPALASNKYARLVEIAEEIVANRAKLIVFTSFNKMNNIIVNDFTRRFGIYSNSITGSIPSGDRQKIVDEFSAVHGPAVLVLNPIAAGSGLNITSANHVVHYNLEWNPAKEDQASARAYRRGQDRPVTIHRLIYADTVDEVIDNRLSRKRELSGSALIGIQGEENDYDDIIEALKKSPTLKK